MSYLKSSTEKTKSNNSSVSEDLESKKGISAIAVPALQLQAEEEELQMKHEPAQLVEEEEALQGKFIAQLEGDEEEMQMKNDPTQLVEEEEPLQGKFTAQLEGDEDEVQMKSEPNQLVEEEEPLQGKFEPIQKKADIYPSQSKQINSENAVQRQQNGESSNQTGMPSHLKSGIENLSGYSMNDVKIHYNSDKPKQLHAHAYAQGTDIHIAPGQEKHLPHEAWHVAQQKQGRVQATRQMKTGPPVNDDKGLENEADLMGAKAAETGIKLQAKALTQFKQNNSLVAQLEGESETSGRSRSNAIFEAETPTRSRSNAIFEGDPDMAFKAKNAGLISMSEKASVVLGDPVWTNLVAGSDDLGTGIAVSGAIGAVTGLSGTATSALDGSGEKTKEIQKTKGSSSFLSEAEGDILNGIGSAISSVVSVVSAVKTIYGAHKGDESKIAASVTATKLLMQALKSGFEAGMSIQKFVSGSVTPGIVSALPGLGLAINAADLLVNAYNAYASRQNEKDMTTVSDEYRGKLTETLGKSPESHTKLFQNEKRGKFGNRITYLRLLPEMMERMDFIKKITDPKARTTSENAFKTIFDIAPTVNFDSLYLGIRFYEMGSKMQEINQKRKVAGSRSILTGLIKIAGDIASFFPGPGSVVAGSLKGVAATIEVAQSAAKFLQKQARNNAVLGGNVNRSTDAKHKEYVSHAKSIYYYIDNIPKPITSAQEPQLTKAEQLLKSTGVFLPAVYKTDYTNSSQISTQVGLIVDSMKAGR